MMDPQQEIFSAFRQGLETLFPDSVYDGILPPEGTPYPFVYIGDTTSTDRQMAKTVLTADVTIRIHIWHNNPFKRGTLSDIMLKVKRFAREVTDTPGASWTLEDINQTIQPDSTTNQPLLHGVLDFSYRMRGIK